MRGNLVGVQVAPDVMRSIPACAGEPPASAALSAFSAVYPRVCGGTVITMEVTNRDTGLSPRVRGNLGSVAVGHCIERSIPACAGEPFGTAARKMAFTVYPRVCGGTTACCASMLENSGLSPRVRGNPGQHSPILPADGSIPACAGEPKAMCSS